MLRSLLVIGLLVTATMIVAVGHSAATLPADVEVVDGECVEGKIYRLTVETTLHADEPMTGTFRTWTQRDRVRMDWGRHRIQPGTQTVTLFANSEKALLEYGDRAQLMLNVGQQRAYDHFRRQVICR